jgi:hypothetical protein
LAGSVAAILDIIDDFLRTHAWITEHAIAVVRETINVAARDAGMLASPTRVS